MPAYNNTPFKAPPILQVAAHPVWLFGGFDDKTAPTKMQVTSVAITGNVATLHVFVREGNIPVVGNLVSVQGTQNTAGVFNVKDVALTGVTINADTGIGTITFALVHADIATAADAGIAAITAPETSEATGAFSSIPFTPSFSDPETADARTQTLIVSFPTEPTTWTGNLQVALRDVDSDYVNINTGVDITFASGTDSYLFQYFCQSGLFYRLKQNSGSTTDGKIIAKIMS